MAKVVVKNMTGSQAGEMELNTEVFEVAPSVALLHQAVLTEEANQRRGTHETKTRSEVSGGGAKPFRQKGTGRARQGSTRAPHFAHGGVVFGPHMRSYDKKLPKKMRRAAIRSALSARLADGDIVIVDEIKMDKISTKQMVQFLAGLEAVGKVLLVVENMSEEVRLSSRNIPNLQVRISPAVSARDLLASKKIIMTKGAVEILQGVLI